MKLVLIRHGRPDEDDIERPHDPPLRARGLDAIGVFSVNENGHHAGRNE